MELLVLTTVAVLLTVGFYLLLDRTLLRVVIGIGLIGNGINLLLLSTAGLVTGAAPIIGAAGGGADADGAAIVDPLPQALILTAIVIGFGVIALLLTLAYRTFETKGTDDLGELHGRLGDE